MFDTAIIIDSNEQLPYDFSLIDPQPKTIRRKLKTGDYSLEGFENRVCVERKTAADLFGSMGRGRVNLEKEFQRMASFDFAAFMIEDDWTNILKNPPVYSQMNPRAVFRTCLAWAVKYGVHVVWGHRREHAEKITYILLENFLKYHGR
jgi:ERCC4-type nuclease